MSLVCPKSTTTWVKQNGENILLGNPLNHANALSLDTIPATYKKGGTVFSGTSIESMTINAISPPIVEFNL
jgi:hypothetical protein